MTFWHAVFLLVLGFVCLGAGAIVVLCAGVNNPLFIERLMVIGGALLMGIGVILLLIVAFWSICEFMRV